MGNLSFLCCIDSQRKVLGRYNDRDTNNMQERKKERKFYSIKGAMSWYIVTNSLDHRFLQCPCKSRDSLYFAENWASKLILKKISVSALPNVYTHSTLINAILFF